MTDHQLNNVIKQTKDITENQTKPPKFVGPTNSNRNTAQSLMNKMI